MDLAIGHRPPFNLHCNGVEKDFVGFLVQHQSLEIGLISMPYVFSRTA
jgi:hypothetical protein